MSRTAPVGWCAGKDCRKCDGYREMRKELEAHCHVVELPCLDLCKGAVVVVDPHADKPLVFEKVRRKGLHDLIAHVTQAAPLTKRLKSRRLSSADRAKAQRRIASALD